MAQERKSNQRGSEPANGGPKATSVERDRSQANKGESIRQHAEEMAHSAREHYDDAREAVAHRYQQTERMIARNPAPSVMIGFGLGIAAGMLLAAICTREEETWYERHMPERLRDMPDRLRAMSRDVPSRLRNLPDQLMERIGV
jgi:ElaB/YqjD/DUF883 family membrane-anchored ribosome-binding protein